MDVTSLIRERIARQEDGLRPFVVGVSGYGGSGKSTLARRLCDELADAYRVRGDDFLDPARSHRRSTDWDGVDRVRLVDEVLAPIRAQESTTFRRFDWSRRQLGEAEVLSGARVYVVDVIGLFHPEALPYLDVAVWCDVDLDTATERGIRRDRLLGRDHESLWREV